MVRDQEGREVCCQYCKNKDLEKDGKSKQGKQKYQCRSCKKYGTVDNTRFYSEADQKKLLGLNNERMSLRAISRQFGVSRQTLAKWLKKKTCTAS